MRELAAVRAERVRLDQLGAGVDEADVQRDDRLWCAQVRLLGTSQPRNGSAEQGPHASVRDDRRAFLQTFDESALSLRCGHSRLLRSTHPPGLAPGRAWHLAGTGRLPGFKGPVPSASLDAERDVSRIRTPSIRSASR